MQKLKLKLQSLPNTEVLTRSQLKNVLGGLEEATTTGCPSGSAPCSCNGKSNGCQTVHTCCTLCGVVC